MGKQTLANFAPFAELDVLPLCLVDTELSSCWGAGAPSRDVSSCR